MVATPSSVIVMFVNSHLDGKAVSERRFPARLILASATADEVASTAAGGCRVSHSDRHRVHMAEKKAFM
eukprot:8644922-Pyramimonas_sp.AAC.1